jgi:glycosyltransferase involved in cell wall biosynthesis
MALLSVLIPAYCYAEGVDRILSRLLRDPSHEIEIIISDDSPDDLVYNCVANFSRSCPDAIKYKRNRPGLGAVANWSSLIQQACGEYILLLHHDEFPVDCEFINNVLKILKEDSDTDVFVLECILMSVTGAVARPHLPTFLKVLAIKYFPIYLFKRNVVGPTSCLIIRRDLYPRFDDRLRWLVDVEAYFRLREVTARWRFCRNLRIGSVLGRKDSITSSIKNDLGLLDASERAYLCNKYPIAEVWLDPGIHWAANTLEAIAWGAMRVVTRVWHRFSYSSRLASFSSPYLQRTTKNDHQ